VAQNHKPLDDVLQFANIAACGVHRTITESSGRRLGWESQASGPPRQLLFGPFNTCGTGFGI